MDTVERKASIPASSAPASEVNATGCCRAAHTEDGTSWRVFWRFKLHQPQPLYASPGEIASKIFAHRSALPVLNRRGVSTPLADCRKIASFSQRHS